MSATENLFHQAERLQNLLVSFATGGNGDDSTYTVLRRALLAEPTLTDIVPEFVKSCRNLEHFWQYIKAEFAHYAERRLFIWAAFSPLLQRLEASRGAPADEAVSTTVASLSSDTVHILWTKALARRSHDPEGAITAARTLLESVCKHILDVV